jgi:hypothetical protein
MPKNIDRDEFMGLMTCIQEARATMERLLPLALEPLRRGSHPSPSCTRPRNGPHTTQHGEDVTSARTT